MVIIGATRYYKYDWDADAKRIKKDNNLEPEAEEAAMVQFAEHHKLKHRFMVTPTGSKFQTGYAVSGIPQAVLIGRDGKIRMIKVGSGSANAAALHHEIEKSELRVGYVGWGLLEDESSPDWYEKDLNIKILRLGKYAVDIKQSAHAGRAPRVLGWTSHRRQQ